MLCLWILLTFGAVFAPVLSQRTNCSRDRMRQCQDTLVRNIQKRVIDMNRSEMTAHCELVRDDFNCLLQETRCLSSETERNRNGDTLRNTLKYIRDGCDTQGTSWRDSTCYIGEGIKTCESSYPLGGSQYSSHNPETCRKFNLFQECVMETTRSRCRPDDERYLGQYLVDSAQDLAWNCGEGTSTSNFGRNRDDRYRDSYEKNGDTYRDRDRDRDWDRGRDWTSNRGTSRDGQYSRDRDPYDRDRYDRNGGYDRNSNSGSSDITCCSNERCSSSRMQRCKDSLSRTIDIRLSGYQDSQKCRKARDDFNCLLWQTANCQSRSDRDVDNDIFRKARDYISRNCDSYGRWSENSCYKSTEMQRCENALTSTRGGANFESCRSYNNFRDCMQNELQRRCTREDELYQGAYLVDKVNELSWQCASFQSGGRDSYRNQYYTNDNRRDRDQYDSNYGGFGGGYDNPPHLDDDDALCQSRIKSYVDQCEESVQNKRREIHINDDYNQNQKIKCCSARQYRSCLYEATRRVCQSDNKKVVDAQMGRYGYELNTDQCRRIYEGDCNSCSSYQISFILFLGYFIMLQLFSSHLQ